MRKSLLYYKLKTLEWVKRRNLYRVYIRELDRKLSIEMFIIYMTTGPCYSTINLF